MRTYHCIVVLTAAALIGCQGRSKQAPAAAAPVYHSPYSADDPSDSELAYRVKAAINWQMSSNPVQPRDLTVGVVGGDVTLRGTVGSWTDKSTIDATAGAVMGVKSVDSRLVVAIWRAY